MILYFQTLQFFGELSVFIAVIVAFVSRIFKIHDRISDVLSIRKNYDINNIILPLANKVGIHTSASYTKKLVIKRSEVMNNIFYKYASSTKESCQIDQHLVIQAMSQLTALWISIEFIFWFSIVTLVLLITGYYRISIFLLTIDIFLIFISWILYILCKKYTKQEIDAIIDNDKIKDNIKNYLNEI